MILDDLATYLAAQSTAFTVGATGNLVKGISLDAATVPNTLAALYETPGSPTTFVFSTSTGSVGVVWERPSIQLLSRSTSYQTARNKAETAYALLDGLNQKNLPTSTGTLYNEIVAAQPPFLLQRDESDRYIVAVNFEVRKARS